MPAVRRAALPPLVLSALLEPDLRLRSQIGYSRYDRHPLRTQALPLLRRARMRIRGRARIACWPCRRPRCLPMRALPLAMDRRASHTNSEQRTRHGLPPPVESKDSLGTGDLRLREPQARAKRPVRALRLVLKSTLSRDGRLGCPCGAAALVDGLAITQGPATPCGGTMMRCCAVLGAGRTKSTETGAACRRAGLTSHSSRKWTKRAEERVPALSRLSCCGRPTNRELISDAVRGGH